MYSNSTPVTFDVVAAGVSGNLGYLVGYERGSASVGGAPAEPVNLRITQVTGGRTANGSWFIGTVTPYLAAVQQSVTSVQ